MMTLYFTPQSCALASHIALEQAGADYEAKRVDFSKNEQQSPEYLGACFELIEHEVLQGPWVMGSQYTICDGYLFTVSQWLEGDGVDIGRLPKVADHRRRMLETPAVANAMAAERAEPSKI